VIRDSKTEFEENGVSQTTLGELEKVSRYSFVRKQMSRHDQLLLLSHGIAFLFIFISVVHPNRKNPSLSAASSACTAKKRATAGIPAEGASGALKIPGVLGRSLLSSDCFIRGLAAGLPHLRLTTFSKSHNSRDIESAKSNTFVYIGFALIVGFGEHLLTRSK